MTTEKKVSKWITIVETFSLQMKIKQQMFYSNGPKKTQKRKEKQLLGPSLQTIGNFN